MTNWRYAWRIGVVTMAACGGDMSPRGIPPAAHAVVTRLAPASAAQCPAGGSIASAGLDTNDNGVLDDGEATSQTVQCTDPATTPPPAPPVVVRIVAEPAGANCAQGGTAVQTGLDGNGNGQLDDAEVLHSDYLCGGGELLTRMVPEPEGAHCAAGGIALLIGRDQDGDHQLADAEVERTEYECGDILSHDVAIHSQAEAATVAHIRLINGSLQISDPLDGPDGSLEEIVLPELQQVRDALEVSNVKLATRLSLPALQIVGTTTRITDNALLTVIEVPQLFRIGGSLEISRNPELLDLTRVIPPSVRGDLRIIDNPALLSVPVLAAVPGEIEVSGNTALARLDVSVFEPQPGALRIADNGVTTVTVTSVATAGAFPALGSMQIADNPQLTQVGISGSVVGGVEVTGNAGLDEVHILADEIDGDVTLSGNARADLLTLDARDSFTLEITGSLTVSGPITFVLVGAGHSLFVGGDLTLDRTQMRSLPSELVRVTGTLRLFGNDELVRVAIPFNITGLDIDSNPRLDTLSVFLAPDLVSAIAVRSNPKLTSLPALETVETFGDVTINNNDALASLALHATRVGRLRVAQNPALASFSLDRLANATDITLSSNPLVPQLSLPALVNLQTLLVEINNGLHHLALPVLTQAASLQILHNHHLPACQAAAVLAGITAPKKVQVDNDNAATCLQ